MKYEVEMKTITPREIIETDRERYKSIILKPDRDRWIFATYGQDLNDTAEDIYDRRIKAKDFYCRICKVPFELDEEFARLSFSFCDEYGCGMDIHINIENCVSNRGEY
jgi:hypothetical protein